MDTADRRPTGRPRTGATARRAPAAAAVAAGARVAYGAALVLAPDTVVGIAASTPPGDTVRVVARVLGVRHLVQALLTADRPAPAALTLGALVDLLHLASMLGLAVVDPRHRRYALLDAGAAAGWAATGAAAARAGAPGEARTAAGAARNRIASVLAARLRWIPSE